MRGLLGDSPLIAGLSYVWFQLPDDLAARCQQFQDERGRWPLHVVVPEVLPRGMELDLLWFKERGIAVIKCECAVYGYVGPLEAPPPVSVEEAARVIAEMLPPEPQATTIREIGQQLRFQV